MADLIQSPAVRKVYTTTNLDNPIFVDDFLAHSQFIQTMAKVLSGLGSSDFAILSGLDFVAGTPNTYTAGYFYFNGVFYYQPSTFNENSYLHANLTNTLPISFPADGITRDIYTINYSLANGTSSGGTPQFVGDMNRYRIGLKILNNNLQPVIFGNEQVADLGSGYTVSFTNDKGVFFAAASANATVDFDLTDAVPGVVVTLKWTFGSGKTLIITPPGGGALIAESGDLGLAASNTNILNCIYVGLNESGDPEVRYTFNQAL